MPRPGRTLPLLLVCFLLGLSSVLAQNSDPYPTLTALQAAELPPRDRAAIAQRFGLGTPSSLTPTPSGPRVIGEHDQFWVSNSATNTTTQISATLRAVGQSAYVWMQDGYPVTDTDAARIVEVFDATIYAPLRELWGEEPSPGVDGDPRVYLLFVGGIAPGTAAYFSSDHAYDPALVPFSSGHEVILFNLDAIGTALDSPNIHSLLAHEFQHMIRFAVDRNEENWLDEGFSSFSEVWLGYSNPIGAAGSFLAQPNTQLNAWSVDNRAPHYGAALMFVTYLYERYGEETLRTLSRETLDGTFGLETVLGAEAVQALFADWLLANLLSDPDSYGYRLLPAALPAPSLIANVTALPDTYGGGVNQYAADYHGLYRVDQPFTVQLTMAQDVALLPTQAENGTWFVWSNRGDRSNTTLTRTIDLTGVTTATLHYRAWVQLELFWDYGYLAVSTDGGLTWTTLDTPRTTRDDPYGKSVGAGYTGDLGGWFDEAVSLDAYAGRTIQIRFEMITDDAIALPGMAIDDVSVPEIGYREDFENGLGDWMAAGWIRTDNRLPQRAWVQAVQQRADGSLIAGSLQRWRFPDDVEQIWTVTPVQDAVQTVIVVAPFTPGTTEPADYTLTLSP